METLDQWFLSNAEEIDLQVRVFDKPILKENNITDIDSKIRVGNAEYWGRGTSRDPQLSLRKSCCEAVERFFLHRNKISTSNGFAVHSESTDAIEIAKRELIERDLFMCHFLTQTPFQRIKVDDPWISHIEISLNASGIGLNFYTMGSINSIEGVLCAISGKNADNKFGYILGTAAGCRQTSITSSFYEAFRNFAHLQVNNQMTLNAFLEKSKYEKITFNDHGNLALDPEYALRGLDTILSDSAGKGMSESLALDWKVHVLDMANTPFHNSPLVVVRASTPHLQDLFTGEIRDSVINEERLRLFCKAYSRDFSLSSMPHPFN